MRMSSWSHFAELLSSNHFEFHVLMTPRRKPYGWTFCPMVGSFLSLAENDGDVAQALLNTRGTTHRARTPAAHVLVGGLVDEGGLHEERVEIHARSLGLRVRDGALDELLDDRRGRFLRELEQLQRLARLPSADEVHHDSGLARTYPREPSNCLADHSRILRATVVPTGIEPLLAARA